MALDLAQERQQAHAYLDQLPASQLTAVRYLLESMVDPLTHTIAQAPVDDERLTEDEEQALDRAEVWLRQNGGKGIPHEEVLAEFGLTMRDFPLK